MATLLRRVGKLETLAPEGTLSCRLIPSSAQVKPKLMDGHLEGTIRPMKVCLTLAEGQVGMEFSELTLADITTPKSSRLLE
mmetsp:Transcript_28114/g.71678  ORF Transcript_28114/g.71678 Transcript_28114/m.71678 type:complete len:81 (-) Transcript_28114:937-1179(-)